MQRTKWILGFLVILILGYLGGMKAGLFGASSKEEASPLEITGSTEEIESTEFQATPPTFKALFEDEETGETIEKELPLSDLTFSYDDKKIKVVEDQILLPETEEEELELTATYTDSKEKIHNFNFIVIIPENEAKIIDFDDFEDPTEFVFSSGVGGWRTYLLLEKDGSFEGQYSATSMGDHGENYEFSADISKFSGQFEEIEQVDELTYRMKLNDLDYEYEFGEEWIEDEAKYTATDAYGLVDGEYFYLYHPEKMTHEMDEMLLSWHPLRLSHESDNEPIGYWVLHNDATGDGFYSQNE